MDPKSIAAGLTSTSTPTPVTLMNPRWISRPCRLTMMLIAPLTWPAVVGLKNTVTFLPPCALKLVGFTVNAPLVDSRVKSSAEDGVIVKICDEAQPTKAFPRFKEAGVTVNAASPTPLTSTVFVVDPPREDPATRIWPEKFATLFGVKVTVTVRWPCGTNVKALGLTENPGGELMVKFASTVFRLVTVNV